MGQGVAIAVSLLDTTGTGLLTGASGVGGNEMDDHVNHLRGRALWLFHREESSLTQSLPFRLGPLLKTPSFESISQT